MNSEAATRAAFEPSRGWADRCFADHPGKRTTEIFWLAYTGVWGSVVGAVMLLGYGETWGDAPLITMATILAVGAIVGPYVLRPASERELSFLDTAAGKLGLSVIGLAFGLNYTQTPFFYDVLHMHYGFRTTVTIRDNPVALYILTIPYFATYAALCLVAYRFVRSSLAGAPNVARGAAMVLTPFAVAFLETVLNANPFTRRLFCYDDMPLVLWFGTFAYGTAFCFALPVWLQIDESRDKRVSWFFVATCVCAALYADAILLDVYRYHLAPRVTTVVPGAVGLRDYANSCLAPPAN